MYAKVSVTKQQSKLPNLAATVEKLARARVLVGVPAPKASRKGSGQINNAELLFIHTEGSPARGIPARPVLQPAIHDPQNQATITRQMEAAAEGAFSGDHAALGVGLAKAGTAAANAARDWFTNSRNHWAPNSQATINAKASDRPLIDTGQLRRAITYVVDEDGSA